MTQTPTPMAEKAVCTTADGEGGLVELTIEITFAEQLPDDSNTATALIGLEVLYGEGAMKFNDDRTVLTLSGTAEPDQIPYLFMGTQGVALIILGIHLPELEMIEASAS